MIIQILIRAFSIFCEFIQFMIVLRAILSWIVRDYSNPVVKFAHMVTEPVIYPFRRIISKSPFGNLGGLDISPVFAYLAVEFVNVFLSSMLL